MGSLDFSALSFSTAKYCMSVKMAFSLSEFTSSNVVTVVVVTFISSIIYTLFLTVSRLYFSPISHIPGPKLAAATWWYEFYFQVVKGGQYFKEIARLHKQYGT